MGDGDSMIWIVLDADEEDGEPLAKFFSMTDLSSKAYGGSAGNPSDRAARRAALPKNSAVLVKGRSWPTLNMLFLIFVKFSSSQ